MQNLRLEKSELLLRTSTMSLLLRSAQALVRRPSPLGAHSMAHSMARQLASAATATTPSPEVPGRVPGRNPHRNPGRKLALLALLAASAAAYLAYEREPTDLLSPAEFRPFRIVHTKDLDPDHYVIEMEPVYTSWKSQPGQAAALWSSSKLWSVEIMQPQIMVVRNYTPLPLVLDSENQLQLNAAFAENGRLLLYIKKYSQGEVARWISRKPLGDELYLRGPLVELDLAAVDHQVDELDFFAGGTGIAPILQHLLSSRLDQHPEKNENHSRTFRKYNIFYSAGATSAAEPFFKLLSSHPGPNPVQLTQFAHRLAGRDVPQFSDKSFSIVCGPDGYIAHLSGLKPYNGQGQIAGLLGEKGWHRNVFKM